MRKPPAKDFESTRKPLAQRFLQLMPLVCGLTPFLLSCRDGATESTTSSPVTSNARQESAGIERAELDARISLDAVGLVNPGVHVEPSKQGWDSEVVNDSASAQLKALGKLLAHPEQIDGEHVSQLVNTDYGGGSLRPDRLTTAFEDSSLLVRKATIPDESNITQQAVHRGPSGFADSLRGLLEPYGDASDVRSKFKIFRVATSGNEATSRVYFELSGRTEVGIVQQRATWQCRWTRRPDAPPLLTSITVSRYEEVTGKSASGTLFSDCTESALGANPSYRTQLAHSTDHWIDRIEFRYGIDPGAWMGIAVGDINGDDLEDIYVCQPGGLPNRLFVQNADGSATDASARAGVDWLDHTHAALILDVDNDSDQDMVLALKRGLVFLANDGEGHFSISATKLIPRGAPYALSAADYDDDGDLDLYACCYSVRRGDADRNFLQRPVPYHDANNGGRNVLLSNHGRWRFVDATQQVGLNQNNSRFSFAASWDDYDNDGDLDLYVANDYGRNNLYRNDQGRFIDVAAEAGVEDISAGMSVSWGDYNNDGWMDIYVSNMFSSAGNRIAYERRFHANANQRTRSEFQRHARGNSLFENAGNGTFRDVSVDAGVTMGRWAWGSNFVDLNNDGWEDLVVANGFITREDTSDL